MSSTIDPVRYTIHLHQLALFLLLFSTIFWTWAIINTATKNYVDGGILSFLTVMLTSAYLLYIIRKGSGEIGSESDGGSNTNNNCCRTFSILALSPASHLLVIINYALGAILTDHLWGAIYCIVFTGLWVGFAIIYLVLVYMIRKGGDDGGDEAAPATAAGSTGVSSGANEEVVGKLKEGEMA